MHTTTTLLTALTSASLALAGPAPAPHPPLVTPAPMVQAVAARLGVRQFRPSSAEADFSKSTECLREYTSLAESAPRETSNRELARWMVSAASPIADAVTATEIDDSLTSVCDASVTAITPPASLSSAYSTYRESADSWLTSVAPSASSVAQSCGGQIGSLIQLLVITDGESCTKAVLGMVDAINGDDGATTTTGGDSASATQTTAPEETETNSAGGDGDDDADDNNDGDDDSGNGNGDSDDGNDDADDGSAGAAETTSTSTAGVPRETGMMGVAAAAAVAVAGVVAAL
ncbi:uncharacterized protein B0H64DRAFT_403137 [Chaetomium fimeti]|uniref:Infection structure specific protein n=1 Tax=Chaetomium fimeti TaxID=1854472 RepID=A0AAE0LPX7_9PEZI|nr:hypothetical protein B0H64DRAFT_403137 [Chaetomium fimeti]